MSQSATKPMLAREEILRAIASAKSAVVVAHVNPDGDTLGSMLALARMLEKAGIPRVDRVMHDKVPEIYKFFPDQERVLCSYDENDRKQILGSYKLNAEQKLERIDAASPEQGMGIASPAARNDSQAPVIARSAEGTTKQSTSYDISFSCDCGSIDRLASAGVVWANARISCNIDHHLSNTLFADLNWVEPEATSTGQVVYNMINSWNATVDDSLKSAWAAARGSACGDPPPTSHLVRTRVDIDRELASLMYITLLTDTAGFRHANTNELALSWGAELIKLGASPSELYNQLFNQTPLPTIQIGGAALAALEIHELKRGGKTIRVAYTETDRALLDRYQGDDEHTDEIVDHIMRVRGLDACLYLREARKPGHFKGSLRSANPDIDCAKLAALINGGGHARAAGFNIEAKSFSELKARVFGLLACP